MYDPAQAPLTVMGGLAEFERKLIRQRCDEGIRRAKALGKEFGRKTALDPGQRKVIAERYAGGETMRALATQYGVGEATVALPDRRNPLARLFRGRPRNAGRTGAYRLPMVDGVNNPGFGSGETAIIYEGLRGLAPFGGLTAAELADIAERMRRHRFARGDVIIRQGDLGETFYLVRSGTVDVTRRAGAAGPEHHVTTLGPGTCFGEHALIEDELRNASVVAAEEVEVYALAKTDFWRLLGQIPNFRGLIWIS